MKTILPVYFGQSLLQFDSHDKERRKQKESFFSFFFRVIVELTESLSPDFEPENIMEQLNQKMKLATKRS